MAKDEEQNVAATTPREERRQKVVRAGAAGRGPNAARLARQKAAKESPKERAKRAFASGRGSFLHDGTLYTSADQLPAELK